MVAGTTFNSNLTITDIGSATNIREYPDNIVATGSFTEIHTRCCKRGAIYLGKAGV